VWWWGDYCYGSGALPGGDAYSGGEACRRLLISIIQNGVWLTALLGVDRASIRRSVKRCEDIAFQCFCGIVGFVVWCGWWLLRCCEMVFWVRCSGFVVFRGLGLLAGFGVGW